MILTALPPTLPYTALPCPDQPKLHCAVNPALPCPALPCPVLPCPALYYPAPPCPALPCPALSYPALPCSEPLRCAVNPALHSPALPLTVLLCPALYHPCGLILIYVLQSMGEHGRQFSLPPPLPLPLPPCHCLSPLVTALCSLPCLVPPAMCPLCFVPLSCAPAGEGAVR
jgi:hypothetical protein